MAITYIPFRFPGVPHVRCAFQTRAGGNISFMVGDAAHSVTANRSSLREALGLTACTDLTQVHGDALIFEPAPVADDSKPAREADGHATTVPGLGLIIKTADCQPILIAHKDGRHIMALHAGWRGNRMDFPGSAVARFCAHYDVRPCDLFAVRGPSLGPAASEFVNFDTEWGADFTAWFDAKTRTMDLWALTHHQLRQAGLPKAHIFELDMCTHTMHDVFFSYRRENIAGRQGSVLWMC